MTKPYKHKEGRLVMKKYLNLRGTLHDKKSSKLKGRPFITKNFPNPRGDP